MGLGGSHSLHRHGQQAWTESCVLVRTLETPHSTKVGARSPTSTTSAGWGTIRKASLADDASRSCHPWSTCSPVRHFRRAALDPDSRALTRAHRVTGRRVPRTRRRNCPRLQHRRSALPFDSRTPSQDIPKFATRRPALRSISTRPSVFSAQPGPFLRR